MAKKFLNYIFLFILFLMLVSNYSPAVSSEVLTGSVSMTPASFFGVWRVSSKRIDTDAPFIFKENNIDLWNLSKVGDVITLKNPFNGASADIIIDSVEGKNIVFTKKGKYGNKFLTDIVELKLDGNTFEGTDSLQLDTYSDVSGKIIKSETAKYYIKGEKIAGE